MNQCMGIRRDNINDVRGCPGSQESEYAEGSGYSYDVRCACYDCYFFISIIDTGDGCDTTRQYRVSSFRYVRDFT